MTIVVTGGGSGGHITPILAVAHELKRLKPEARVVFIGQTGDDLGDLPKRDPNIDAVYSVRAGKFRRYHGEGWRQVLDLKSQLKNIRDGFRVIAGIWQSFWLLRRLQPEIIFTRGGFVSVPVALGGKLNDIPYITHDSDSTPSLANRLIACWARLHAVALPIELYPYPAKKTKVVGIPVSHNYQPVTPRLMRHYRKLLNLEGYEQVVLVTGGGNGAQKLNDMIVANASYLLKHCPKLAILHLSGRSLEAATNKAYDIAVQPADRKRVIVEGFVTDLYRYSGAADIVIARAGATNLAEFAIQGKACVIIPSEQLRWQIHHAEVLYKRRAIELLREAQAEQVQRLATVLIDLLEHPKKRQELGEHLFKLARPDSAHELAVLLLSQAASGAIRKRKTT